MFEAEYTYGILYCFTLFMLFCLTCCSWSNICRVQLIVLLMNQHDILTYVRSRMFWQIQQWKQLGRTSIRTAPIPSTVGQVLSCKIREKCDMHTSGFNLLGVGGWGDQLDLKHYEDVPCMWYRFKWRIVPIGNTYVYSTQLLQMQRFIFCRLTIQWLYYMYYCRLVHGLYVRWR